MKTQIQQSQHFNEKIRYILMPLLILKIKSILMNICK